MATKRAAKGGKSATKKASKKSASKKSAAKKGASTAAGGVPIPNLRCIEACFERYRRCLSKGNSPAICMKRLQKNLLNCQRGIFPQDE